MENKDLFGMPQTRLPRTKPVKWYLPTNHLNMMYMLSAGLIMSPKGFGKKYYTDALNTFPGWVPLFANTVPKQVIDLCVSEADHLIPCAMTINLASVQGKAMAVLKTGANRQIDFPGQIDGNEAFVLLRSPLPVSFIDAIVFQSNEDRQACETDAQDYVNVPLPDFKRSVNARLIFGSRSDQWSRVTFSLPNYNRSPDIALAAGGIMAMLFQISNTCVEASNACRLAFDGEIEVAEQIGNPMLRGLHDWYGAGDVPPSEDFLQKLFWDIINQVAEARSAAPLSSSVDVLLSYLDCAKTTMDEKHKTAVSKLLNELRAIAGYSEHTMTEIFERLPKLFSKTMALFILRRTCTDLLDFKHPLLSHDDLMISAILFGARDGWIGLPLDLRNQPGMNAAVSHRMAAMAHRISGTGMDLGHPPARCMPIRELFFPGSKGWSKKQKEAALLVAREKKWDFVQTTIRIGKGDYQLVVDGRGVQIRFPGEIKAFETEVDMSEFFEKMPGMSVSEKTDKKIRDLLK